MSKVRYGLDFGTSNSAIAVYRGDKVEVVPLSAGGAKTIKSVMYFDGNKPYPEVGQTAIAKYVENGMTGRFIQSIKSMLPDPLFDGSVIFGRPISIEEFVTFILRHLKEAADAYTGENVGTVVLGRPARFSPVPEEDRLAQERLRTAASRVGFTDIYFQPEPVAAALTYAHNQRHEQLVLVADLGGGTSDFTIMRLLPRQLDANNLPHQILATSGVEIGGDLLDTRLMFNRITKYFGLNLKWRHFDRLCEMPRHLMGQISDWRRISFLKNAYDREFIQRLMAFSDDTDSAKRLSALIEENLAYSLFRSIENAKCRLSSWQSARVLYRQSIINIAERVTRDQFNEDIDGERIALQSCVESMLSRAGINAADIEVIFMTGGTSYVPRFRTLLAGMFPQASMRTGDAFTSVVYGLALTDPETL
ncbi:MAG: Hsp70 family protein [Patescibacteria group bacterium]|jgi:hypothetical chaperone protein